MSDQDIARRWNVSVRVPPAGGMGAVGFDNRYLLDRSRNKEQDFDFVFVTAEPV